MVFSGSKQLKAHLRCLSKRGNDVFYKVLHLPQVNSNNIKTVYSSSATTLIKAKT